MKVPFDSYDAIYKDEVIVFSNLSKGFPRNRNDALVRLAGTGKRLLEIGSGGGNVLYNLRNSFSELHGIDLSPVRIEAIKKKLQLEEINNISVSVGNIESGLSFPDGYFDVILWADVIEHVVDVWSAMEEIRRLLSDGGQLVTVTPNIAELRRRLTLMWGFFPSTSGKNEGLDVREGELFDGGHLHYFTFSSLAKLYKRYNIYPIKSLGIGKLGKFHNIYPSLLSGAVCILGVKNDN